jgi:excisionase family DNA binding protein
MTAPCIPDTPEDPLLTTRGAARMLGVSLRTIQLWADAGILTVGRTPGRHRRVHLSEVQRLKDSMATAPVTPAPVPGSAPPLTVEGHKIAVLQVQLSVARDALRVLSVDTRFVPNYLAQHEFTTNVARAALGTLLDVPHNAAT